MLSPTLQSLADIASNTHARIQQDFANINPIIGVNQGMRKAGIPADVMTIDCLKTNKRIIIILHDDLQGIARYQFAYRDKDPSDDFIEIQLSSITSELMYDWIQSYFSAPT